MTKLEKAGLGAGLGAACIAASLIAVAFDYGDGEGLASIFWFGVAVGILPIVRYNRMRKAG
jgi:hypothetical protein